jgi:hypothetical protein
LVYVGFAIFGGGIGEGDWADGRGGCDVRS